MNGHAPAERRMRPANSVYANLETSVFEWMSQLALAHRAVNLGQGFPDSGGPPDVLQAAADALLQGSNQYPLMAGLRSLREAIARHEARFYGLKIDPASQVVVTSGATEALAAALFALIEPGDEAVLFEPFYDAYVPLVRRAGGTPRFVRLSPPDWRLDRAALASTFGPKTKAVVFNNPLNPAGRVFSADEVALLAEFVDGTRAYAIADEVYEHILFDGRRHHPLIAAPGMADRCLKIGSAGKIFSLTGWKVGWVIASPALARLVSRAHQFLTFTTPPNLQTAVAYGLDKDDSYYVALARDLEVKRDRFADGLQEAGLTVLPCEGTYFVNIDIGTLDYRGGDSAFCRHLVEVVGVAAIPVSAFFADRGCDHLVRFCFAKADAVLGEALRRFMPLGDMGRRN
jgi:N-succinyldiaminopimelate aminotransferase